MQSGKRVKQEPLAPEVIIIDDDDSNSYQASKRPGKPRKKSHKHSDKQRRKVKLNQFKNTETLVVTQKVEVKKQKFKCVINLTNVCEHKEKNKLNPKSSEERIVPKCLRKCRKHQAKRRRKTRESSSHWKEEKKLELKCDLGSLSPISLTSLEKSDLSYEDISSDSFTFQSDEDIDILIKRTKDRERRLSLECHQPLYASTNYFESIWDAETVILRSGEMDTSPHSTTTLLLQSQLDMYSPTKRTSPGINIDHCMQNTENYLTYSESRQYSPALPYTAKNVVVDDNLVSNKVDSSLNTNCAFQHSCNVKNEPYSPSESPMCCGDRNHFPYEVHIENTELVNVFGENQNMLDEREMKPNIINLKLGVYSPTTSFNSEAHDVKPRLRPENRMFSTKAPKTEVNSSIYNENNNFVIKAKAKMHECKIKKEL